MNTCIICGIEFEPPKNYTIKKTCSKECYRIHTRNLASEAFLEKSFKPGHKTYNKGKPQTEWLSKEAIEKCSKTHIQHQRHCRSYLSDEEGRYLPHNTNHKGTVTKRTHIHRTGKNKGKVEYEYFINIDWKGNRKPNNLYRRFLWEYYNQQDIPDGYVVHCIDGNSDNLEIDNLELITRRQLAILNKTGYINRSA